MIIKYINILIIITTLFYKIPPHLPLPKGGKIPLFSKEGLGEILQIIGNCNVFSKFHSPLGFMYRLCQRGIIRPA